MKGHLFCKWKWVTKVPEGGTKFQRQLQICSSSSKYFTETIGKLKMDATHHRGKKDLNSTLFQHDSLTDSITLVSSQCCVLFEQLKFEGSNFYFWTNLFGGTSKSVCLKLNSLYIPKNMLVFLYCLSGFQISLFIQSPKSITKESF